MLEKIFQKNQCFIPSSFNLGIISYFLHGITAVILALYFFNRWFSGLRYVIKHYQKNIWSTFIMIKIIQLILFIIIADSITTVFYFLFKCWGAPLLPLWVGFLITALILLLVSITAKETDTVHYDRKRYFISAFVLGIVQSIALLPGISRLAITYAVGRWLGFTHRHSFELSFAIEWPLIVAASIVALYKLVISHELVQLLHMVPQLAMVIGGIGAWYALKLSDVMLKNNLGWIFSIYLMIVSIIELFGWW